MNTTTTHNTMEQGQADEDLTVQQRDIIEAVDALLAGRPPPPRALPSRGSAALQVVQRRELAQRNIESRSVVGEDRWTDSTVVASRWTGEARP
jgi:hypothetical protein